MAARLVADPPLGLRVEPARQEPRELGLRLVEHADGGVAGAGQLAGDVEDADEHLVEIEFGHERAADVEQAAEPGVVERRVCGESSRTLRHARSVTGIRGAFARARAGEPAGPGAVARANR